MNTKEAKYQLLYDAQCGFCSGIVRWIKNSLPAGKVYFIDQNSTDGKHIIRKRFTDFDYNTVVFIAEGRIFLKSDAIIELCRLTKNGWRILVLSGLSHPV